MKEADEENEELRFQTDTWHRLVIVKIIWLRLLTYTDVPEASTINSQGMKQCQN